MAIKIEVIRESNVGTQVAYYFRIPPQDVLPGADKPDKVPAGKALVGQELADYRKGTIVEVLIDYPFSQTRGMSIVEKQGFFVTEWERLALEATDRYKARYKLEGDYYEDDAWVDDETTQNIGGGQP